MPMSQKSPAFALLLTAALAACNSSSPQRAPKNENSSRPFVVKDDAAARKVTSATSRGNEPEFALLPDGLVVTHGDAKGRPVSLVRFGDPQAATIEALARDLGTPKQSDLAECGAGPMHFADFGAIKANFLGGKFVGWFTERGKGLKTGDGLAPGKPFRQMERIGARMVPKSTLDGEFELAGKSGKSGIGGFLGPDEKVQSLYAGTNCFFR